MTKFLAATFMIVALAACANQSPQNASNPKANSDFSGATITGRITSGGHPVPHAVVVVDFQGAALGARADRDGRLDVTGAPTGHHDVFTFADGYLYDHGGFPDLKPGVNDHSRTLVHVGKNPQEPTVSNLTWSATKVKPGATVTVTGTWKAHDKSGISDELFLFVPEFKHVGLFGAGVLHRGKNPDGRYSAKLMVPANARSGKYTAYVFGAQEDCYVNYGWPTRTIEVGQ